MEKEGKRIKRWRGGMDAVQTAQYLHDMAAEGWILDEQIDEEDPSRDVIMREEMKELNRKIDETLSSFEGRVWRLYVSGCSFREIAADLGKNEKSVENAIFRIKQKLKRLLS